MRTRVFVGAIGAAGLTLWALPDRPDPPRESGIVVVPAPPYRWTPGAQPGAQMAATKLPTPPVAAAVDIADGRERWAGDDQPGVWATPATFSDVD